jgi:ribosomal protein S18 acetylase RimI-like enzyme
MENDGMHDLANCSTSGRLLAIRQLTPDEWPLWRVLRLQALSDAPYAFGSKLADWQGIGDSQERWRDRLTSVPVNLIAFLDGRPVGMVSATKRDDNGTVELISMWVAPSGRGSGVGDALVIAVMEWARQQQALRLSLDVKQGNEFATALYRRHGFVDAGQLTPESLEEEPERRFIRNLAT